MYTTTVNTAPRIGSAASHFSCERRGRNRKAGKRPQTRPPTCAATEMVAEEAVAVTMA